MQDRCPYVFADISRGGREMAYCKVVHVCIPAAGDLEASNDRCYCRADESRCAVSRMLETGEFSDRFVQYLNEQDEVYFFRAVAIPKNLGEEQKQKTKNNAMAHGFRVGKCLPNDFADDYIRIERTDFQKSVMDIAFYPMSRQPLQRLVVDITT